MVKSEESDFPCVNSSDEIKEKITASTSLPLLTVPPCTIYENTYGLSDPSYLLNGPQGSGGYYDTPSASCHRFGETQMDSNHQSVACDRFTPELISQYNQQDNQESHVELPVYRQYHSQYTSNYKPTTTRPAAQWYRYPSSNDSGSDPLFTSARRNCYPNVRLYDSQRLIASDTVRGQALPAMQVSQDQFGTSSTLYQVAAVSTVPQLTGLANLDL